MSDTLQGSSIFTGSNYANLVEANSGQVVGVIVFDWVRGNAIGARSLAQRAEESLLACSSLPAAIDVGTVTTSCRAVAEGGSDDGATERPLP